MHEMMENRYIKYLLVAVIPLGFLADALSTSLYYVALAVVVILFFALAYFDERKKKKLYKNEIIPIPIVINIDSTKSTEHVFESLVKSIEKQNPNFTNLEENLKKYLNIFKDDLLFEYSQSVYDEARLISFIQIIRYRLNKIEHSMKNKVEFHLAYYERPAIGFLVGAIFKTDGIVVYQNSDAKDVFEKVAKIDTRKYKEKVREFTKFKITKQKELSDTVLLAIKASSHDIAFNSQSLKEYTNIISMYANHNGTIEEGEDWILYAREIFTMLNQLQAEYKNIVLVHNMPEALALIVGMAIGNYWNIQMTQYDNGEYRKIIKLNEVKCFF
jgi:hypothetical protein